LLPASALATLLQLRPAARTLLAELLLLTGQSLLALSSLSGATLWYAPAALATLLDLLLLLARQALLALTTTLLRLSLSLLGLSRSLATLRAAGLTFVLLLALVFVFRVLALSNDEAAIGSTRAVKRDTQLRHGDRRHQGAGEQDIAKLLQLPDGFEWQVPLLKCD